MADPAYRFEICLEGIEPPIWRRIRVPGDYTFWDLLGGFRGKRPNALYYYRELQSLRDPLHFRNVEG